MSGASSRSRSKSGVVRRERSWLDAILELDDDAPPPVRSASRPSVAQARPPHERPLPPSRSLPAVSQRSDPVAGAAAAEGQGAPWEAEAAPAVLYSRAQAFGGRAVASREVIESAYVEAKKELGVRMHQEDAGTASGRAGGLAQWQQDALAQQLQLELQAVRLRLLEAERDREALRRLAEERLAQAERQVRAEAALRQRAQEEAAALRRERDLLMFGAGQAHVAEAQQRQQEQARQLLEGEVRLLKSSLLLAHEQATGGGDGVAEALATVRGLAADVAHCVEAFQRSGTRLEETVRARQKLETAAITKLREWLQQQQPSPEERCFHEHLQHVEDALRRVEELYDLAVSEPAPLPAEEVAGEPFGSRSAEAQWGSGGLPAVGIVAALEAASEATPGQASRKATSDSQLDVELDVAPAPVSPAMTFGAPRAYSSSPEALPSTASLLLFGGAPPEQ